MATFAAVFRSVDSNKIGYFRRASFFDMVGVRRIAPAVLDSGPCRVRTRACRFTRRGMVEARSTYAVVGRTRQSRGDAHMVGVRLHPQGTRFRESGPRDVRREGCAPVDSAQHAPTSARPDHMRSHAGWLQRQPHRNPRDPI
jgi:hypothetical protein